MITASIKSTFAKLDSDRSAIINRSRDCAALTLPFELPPEGHTEDLELITPWQSLGAKCVNNLASKLVLTLFPPNTPFFKLSISDRDVLKYADSIGAKTQVEDAMVSYENSVMEAMEKAGLRVNAYKALRHLICANSPLIVVTDKLELKVYPVTSYVVERDPLGNPVMFITRETKSSELVPEEFLRELDEDVKKKRDISIYTKAELINGRWEITSAIEDKEIKDPDYKGSYTQEDFSWLCPRWSFLSGENYSRGPVEEYLGDFRSYEALSQLMVEGAAAHAKLLFFVDPNGTVTPSQFTSARNGAAIPGRNDEVGTLQVGKGFDFRVVMETLTQIERRLATAFLLAEGIQRDAERVTAEEIRIMQSQFENAFGGVYSLLSSELQLPLVRIFMRKLGVAKELPSEIAPQIVTGMAGLGRNSDGYKLRSFIASIAQIPESLSVVKMDEVVRRLCTAEGIPHDGIVKTTEEMQAETQQTQMMALANKVAGPVAGNLTKGPETPNE